MKAPYRIFLYPYSFDKKLCLFFQNSKDVKNPIGSFIHFSPPLGRSQRKKWFCHFFTKWCFSKNIIFLPKQIACGKPPAEGNCFFPRERHSWQKGAFGKPPVGRGKKWSIFFKYFFNFRWGIILAIIVCLFELVDSLYFFDFFSENLFFQNIFFRAYPFIPCPQKWSKKYFEKLLKNY